MIGLGQCVSILAQGVRRALADINRVVTSNEKCAMLDGIREVLYRGT